MRLPTLAAASLMAIASPALPGPLAATAQQNSVAADPCARFKWDVTRERALFAAAASPITAAKTGGSPPRIAVDRAYRVTLTPAARVVFPIAPGRPSSAEGSHSGILAFRVPATGSYRIAVDQPMWLDVVADGRLVPATDYEGQHDCDAPRKIVQFALSARTALTLQLSGASTSAVRVAIVRAAGD